MLHGIREGAHRLRRTVQRVANTAAAAGMAAGVAGGAVAARGLMHSKPDLARGVDTALLSYDAIRSAIR